MGRLPLARTAMAALVLVAVVAIGFTLQRVDIRLPWAADPFRVQIALVDAEGLDAADHPAAGVAGTRQGRVVAVHYRSGHAVATLELDPSVRGKIFRNATAVVRPAGIVPVLTVNVLPGTPAAGPLPDRATIPLDRTSTYVTPDRVLDVADADTRAYLQVLVGQADVALKGRGGALAAAVRRAAPLTRAAARLASVAADRRAVVRRLVGQLARIGTALDGRRTDLAGAVDAGTQLLGVTGRRAPQLAATVRALPGTLAAVQSAMAATGALTGPVTRALDATRPAVRDLPAALRQLTALTPVARRTLTAAAGLERDGAAQLPAVRRFTARLGEAATRGLPDVRSAARVIDILARYGKGLAQLGDVISGAVSTNDANGVLARAQFTAVELHPEDLGLPKSAARSVGGHTPRMAVLLAQALQGACRQNALACLLRAVVPGLPKVEATRP